MALALVLASGASPGLATEGGSSFYLLGSGGPGAAVLPPLQGTFFDSTFYLYGGDAKAEREFTVGGNVVAGLEALIPAEFLTMLFVPTTNFLGGTLAVGATLPIGFPTVRADAILTGPLGNQRSLARSDSALVLGDPVLNANVGWKAGANSHIAAMTQVSVPIGQYRKDQLANLAFHRWIVDTSLAYSWNDPKAGWDISAKAGVTFNGTNSYTDYNSGNEFHIEGAIEKSFSKAISAGIQAYHFEQISGDSGDGAVLGDFKGRVSAVGVTAANNFVIGHMPATVRARLFREFGAKNRMEGTSFFLSLSVPLRIRMPSAPPPAP
ncbi:SphA family protein [Sandaracinobacteroides hominis]|uniref:SphA family protein n=1 Tax=Sandaracinobacteroides hominis TaxID=2780086 RepID=UPI001F251B8C|nr:transporter [Sandaracinobacteroides hominis]